MSEAGDVRRMSYTAANALPLKLFHSREVMAGAATGRIYPIHLQFIPTDRCNLNCSWCSCANDTRRVSLPFPRVQRMVEILSRWATRAVTVTGGGEPLMYEHLPETFRLFRHVGWEIGLVTNAFLFDRIDEETLKLMRWCRISCSDDRGLETRELGNIMHRAVMKAPAVDWALSYVVTRDFNAQRLAEYLEFANSHCFTHVRVVSDLLDLDNVPAMDEVRKAVQGHKVDDRLALYQGRKDYVRGQKRCLISLLKPIVSAEGRVYPCCGAQYALEEITRNMPPELCMGDIEDLDAIMAAQRHFDGSVCHRCYYENYNMVLDSLLAPVQHEAFV